LQQGQTVWPFYAHVYAVCTLQFEKGSGCFSVCGPKPIEN
jgi:hypothetical protein